MSSKFKKRGGAKKTVSLSFVQEEEEEAGAFGGSGGGEKVTKKKIKQAPGSLNALLANEGDKGSAEEGDVTVTNEVAAEAIRKSKEDLRNYYQGEHKSYDRPSKLPEEPTNEQPAVDDDTDMSVDVDVKGTGNESGSGSIKSHVEQKAFTGGDFSPKAVKRTHMMSFEDTLESIERARDGVVQSKTNLENKLMRQESERDRLFEAYPDLSRDHTGEGDGEGEDEGKGDESKKRQEQMIEDIKGFRTFCGELVGMLREKESAVGEMKAFVLAQYSKSSKFDRAEIANFATGIFQDARDEFCSCESILERFSAFRNASASTEKVVTREEGMAQRFDQSKPAWNSPNMSQGGVYSSAYVSLSLPDLLHLLITVDLLKEPILGPPPPPAPSPLVEDNENENASVVELTARGWYEGLCQHAFVLTSESQRKDVDVDGDGTLILRVLLRTVLPMAIETLQAVSELDQDRKAAFASSAAEHIQSLVRECEAQASVAQPSPCEATVRLSAELDTLLALFHTC